MTEKTTFSFQIDDLTLEQLVQVSQGLGHQIDKLRQQRAYLKAKITQRLERGERSSIELCEAAAAADSQGLDATAPGALIEAQATT